MAALIREHDWRSTPLGPIATWPASLRTIIEFMLDSPLAMLVAWGPELIQIYNDAYVPILQDKHPHALGQAVSECWPETWGIVEPLSARVLAGETVTLANRPWQVLGKDGLQERYFSTWISPVRDERGIVMGAHFTAIETTEVFDAKAAQASSGQALLVSEQMLSAALAVAGLSVWSWNPVTNELGWSDDLNRIWGVAPEMAVDVDMLMEAIHPEDRPRIKDALAACIDPAGDGTFEAACRVIGIQDQVERWVESRGRAIFLGGKATNVIGAAGEVTKQRLADEQLRHSERRLAAILDQLPVGVGLSDTDGKILLSNAQLDGYLLDIIPSRVPEAARRWKGFAADGSTLARDQYPVARALRGEATSSDFLFQRDESSQVWTRVSAAPFQDEEGRIIGAIFTVQDIDDQKRIEQALRESEVRFRTIADQAPMMMWVTDATGHCTYLNRAWYEFTGRSEAEGLLFGWLTASHPDDKARVGEIFRGAHATKSEVRVEYRVRRADGQYRWVIDAAAPRFEGDEFMGHVGSLIDIDERREWEDSQRILVGELQHRTRNLLAVVGSIANQTMASSDSIAAFHPRFNERLGALSRAQRLLSRSGEDQLTIGTLVRMELDALGAGAEADRIHVCGSEVALPASTAQTLALGLHELATNARKHGALRPEGGRLSVTWRVQNTEGEAERLSIEWVEECTCPIAGEDVPRGYGRELIERALPYALGATSRFELSRKGVRCLIDLPLTRDVGRGAS